MNELPKKLLAADEPAPVTVYNADGESPFLLVADHAGNIMPRALGHLGIAEARNTNGTSPGTSALPVSAGFWRTRSTRDANPTKLFAPRYRLHPSSGRGDLDLRHQRTYSDPG